MTTKKQLLNEIAEFLVKVGFAPNIAACDLVILPSARASVRVDIKGAQTLFVKKLRGKKTIGDSWLDQHANLASPLQNSRPRTLWNQDGWYASEFFPDSITLKAMERPQLLEFDPAAIGYFLAKLHSLEIDVKEETVGLGADPQRHVRPMGALRISEYSAMPGLDRDLYVRVCQRTDAGLAKLSTRLGKICAVHGDFQGNNILLSHAAEGQVRVVDWENAGIGDPAWDFGHLLAALLQRWVHQLNLNTISVADIFDRERGSWAQLANWFSAVAGSYRISARTSVSNDLDRESLFQVAGYATLQRARNILSVYGRFSQKDVLLLSIAEKLIISPAHAISTLTPSLMDWKER